MSEAEEAHPVVLFDGVCNFCNASVNWIIDRDPKARFRFAAQQSEAAHALLAARGVNLPEGDPEGILLVVGEQVHRDSGAALRIAGGLRSVFKVFWVFLVVPWFLRDIVYKFIAKRRYRWFGKSETCRVPTPEIRSRFLPGS